MGLLPEESLSGTLASMVKIMVRVYGSGALQNMIQTG
jgi:hypothetical protein